MRRAEVLYNMTCCENNYDKTTVKMKTKRKQIKKKEEESAQGAEGQVALV